MKLWQKAGGVSAASLVLTAGLFGSAFANGAAAATQTAKRDSGVVHLTYWNMWSGIWFPIIKNMVADFNKTHPNIQVTTVSVPGSNGASEQKLLTAIAAGDPPDVFTEWSPYVAAFAQKGALVNLDQYMTGKYAGLKHWFYPTITQWGSYKGNMYAMPMTMNSFLLYYNKTMYKAAGLNPNDPPRTLAQLDAQQAKLWKFGKGGVVKQMGMYPNWYDVWMAAFNVHIMKNGKYNMMDPNSVKLMNWIASYKKYPYSQVNAFLTGLNSNGGEDPFVIQKQAYNIDGMWEMPAIQHYAPNLQYGVVPFPAPPGGNSGATWVNGNYNEIPSGSKHPQQAFEFISWMTGYDNAAWAAKTYPIGGWVPNSPEITKQPAYQAFLNQQPLRREFVNVMLNPHNEITPATPVDQLFDTTLGNDVTAVLEGKKTPIQALQDVQTVSNNALATTH